MLTQGNLLLLTRERLGHSKFYMKQTALPEERRSQTAPRSARPGCLGNHHLLLQPSKPHLGDRTDSPLRRQTEIDETREETLSIKMSLQGEHPLLRTTAPSWGGSSRGRSVQAKTEGGPQDHVPHAAATFLKGWI